MSQIPADPSLAQPLEPEAPEEASADAAEAPAEEAREAPAATSPSARETVREPFVRAQADEEAPAGEEAPAPEEKAAAAALPLADTHPSVESPLAREFAKLTETTSPPVQREVAAFKAHDEAPSKMEAPALAPTMRTELGDEPKKVAAPKVEVEAPRKAPKAEEPKKVAPAKAEEPKKVAPAKAEEPKKVAPAKAEEPKKVAPAKAEEPRKAVAARAEEQKKAPPSKKSAPDSVRPAARRAPIEDDLDSSSISAEFFRKDEDSVPPVEEHEHEEEALAGLPVLSPTALARRARLRRAVAGVIGFASVISIAVIGKAVAAAKRTPSATQAVVTAVETAREAPAPPREAVKAPEPPKPEPAKVEEPKKADEPVAKADDKKADEPAAKADDKKADDAKAADPPKPAGDAVALKKEAESLLNRGKNKEAIEKSRDAIAADPTDALPYLYLGSALQETGKWKDGIEAYCDCVRNATKGPINECRAMGGHK